MRVEEVLFRATQLASDDPEEALQWATLAVDMLRSSQGDEIAAERLDGFFAEADVQCSCPPGLLARGGFRGSCEMHGAALAAVEGTAATPEIGTAPGQFPGPGLVGVEQSLRQAAEPLNPEHYDQPIRGTAATPGDECNGGSDCAAAVHIHGCFADYGSCDTPGEHRAVSAEPRETTADA